MLMTGSVTCPVCQQSDQVAKVSTLYMEGLGLQKLSKQKGSESKENLHGLRISDPEITRLARQLSPPSSGKSETIRPIHPDWAIAAFTAILPVFLIGIYRSQPAGLILVLIILVFFYGLYFLRRGALIARFHKQQLKRQAETRRVEKAVQKWMRLYYCHRDEGVFSPGQDQLIPIEAMIPYLLEQKTVAQE